MKKEDVENDDSVFKQFANIPRFSSRQVESIAGLSAGFATTIITHPLDIIKIRLQLAHTVVAKDAKDASAAATSKHNKPFQSIVNIIRQINQDARSLAKQASLRSNSVSLRQSVGVNYLIQYYRGLAPNLIGNVSAWGCYFALYAEFKDYINTSNLTIDYFASSSLAGITTSILTNPIWVLKTRIIAKGKNDEGAYKSIIDGIRTMVRNEGIASFWKGSIPSMFQVFQASLQITIYDHLKNYLYKTRAPTEAVPDPVVDGAAAASLSTTQYLYTSATSKIISTLIMYPTQVVKSRLQNNSQSRHTSIMQVVRNLYFHEGGVAAFYKGLSANIVRVVPATCITFVVYEHVKRILID